MVFIAILMTAMITTTVSAAAETSGVDSLKVGGATSGVNGENVDITVDAENVSGVGSFQFSVTYDPSVIKANEVTTGTAFAGGIITNSTNNVVGKVTINGMSASGMSGDGNVATINFTVVGNPPDVTGINITGIEMLNTTSGPVIRKPDVVNGTFTVEGQQTGALSLTIPANITVEATGPKTKVSPGTATTTGGKLPVTIKNDSISGGYAPGTYNVTWNATDANGVSVEKVQEVTVKDTTPPNITIIGDKSVTITVGSVYTDEGATAKDLVDGDRTKNITTTDNVDNKTVGDYSVTYEVNDTRDNSATDKRSVHVVETITPCDTATVGGATQATDCIAPTTTISGVTEGVTYNSNKTITLSAKDNTGGSGVSNTEFKVNGGATSTYTAPFIVSKEGSNTVEARSTDNAGNVEKWKSVSFVINKTGSVTPPGAGNGIIKGKVFNDRDRDKKLDKKEPGIKNVDVIITGLDESNKAIKLSTHTNSKGLYMFENLPDGKYRVHVEHKSKWKHTTSNTKTATIENGDTITVNFGKKHS